MGQYYKFAVGNNIYTHAGTKLLEHAWLGCSANYFQLIKNHPQRVANIGDYTEPEDLKCKDEETKQWLSNADRKAWDERANDGEIQEVDGPLQGILVDHTNKLFITLSKYVKALREISCYAQDMFINPLMILTATSNGGGDYDSDFPFSQFAGTWAGHVIEFLPTEETDNLQGYSELAITFAEFRDIGKQYRSLTKFELEAILKAHYKGE